MLSRKSGYNILFVLIIAVFICIPAVHKFGYRICADFFYPFIDITSKVENFTSLTSTLGKSKQTLVAENSKLIKMLCTLAAKYQRLEKLKKENAELRQLLELKKRAYYNYLFAEIINRDPINRNEHFILNKGKADGVQEGEIVLAVIALPSNEQNINIASLEFGVVGRIGSVSKYTSTVRTIINEECRLGIFIPDNNTTGVLAGGGRTGNAFWAEAKFLPRDLKYTPGAIVETAGKGNSIPPGLLIGRIMGDDSPAIFVYNDLYVVAKIKPVIDLSNLKFVLILVQKND